MHDQYDDIFSDVDRVLVVLAHPDDCEITCGSTIARLSHDGKLVRLVVTTNGGKGVKAKEGVDERELGDARRAEQAEAGKEIGIHPEENINFDIPDGEVEHNLENIGKVVWQIREFKPDLIITHNPFDILITSTWQTHWVNHRDHRNTGLITLDAAYPYSRDHNFFPEQLTYGVTRHEVHKFLFTDSYTKDNVVSFKTDGFLDHKKRALDKHTSAIAKEDIDDYISEMEQKDGYYELLGYTEIY